MEAGTKLLNWSYCPTFDSKKEIGHENLLELWLHLELWLLC